MRKVLRARLTLPVAHVLLFGLTWVLYRLQPQPLLDGPSRWPFWAVFLAD
jgi:hypothetical protein